MSAMCYDESYRLYQRPTHRKNDSGELDVFEATRYFSGSMEVLDFKSMRTPEKSTKDSSDSSETKTYSVEMIRNSPSSLFQAMKAATKEKKTKTKSPAGKLVNFINNLFNHSNRKKSENAATKSLKNEKAVKKVRRNSLSSFYDGNYSNKSVHPSGFRTPPPGLKAPPSTTFNGENKETNSITNSQVRHLRFPHENGAPGVFSDEKFKCYRASMQNNTFSNDGFSKEKYFCHKDVKIKCCLFDEISSKKHLKQFKEDDELVEEDAKSDSSSDLFELKNCHLMRT